MARAVIGALRVTLGLDSAEFTNGIKRASQSTKQFSTAAKSMETAANTVRNAIRGLGVSLGVVSVGAAAKAYLDLADRSAKMTAQIKLATAEFGRFGQAQRDVERIATDTRSGLTETSKLYGTFLRAVKDVGGSQADAARATQTFSSALKIGGATSEEASSATLQFSQALASGALRGDEFNSIMEASPRISRLLADSLGVPVGALRKMAEEGELTSDRLLKALTDKKYTAGIDAEFKQLPVSFGDAMGQIENAAIEVFGAFDRGGEFSKAIANFALFGAQDFSALAASAESFGISVRGTIEGLADVFDPLFDAGNAVFDALGLKASSLGEVIRNFFADGARDFDLITGQLEKGLLGKKGPLGDYGLFSATNVRGNYLAKAGQSDARLALAKIMRGDPLADYKAAQSAVSKGVPRPTSSSAKSGSTKSPKTKKAGPDYSAEAYYEWLAELREDASTPIDFSAVGRSVDNGLDAIARKFEETQKAASESMATLVNNSLNALSNFASAVKNGGFLDILAGAFNAFGALSQQGLFGSSLKSGFKDFNPISGFRAFGGPVTAGHTYVVGERGPELFTASRSGYIHPNASNDNGRRGRAYFDLRGAVMTADLVAQMNAIGDVSTMRGAAGGTAGAVRQQQRASRWRIP